MRIELAAPACLLLGAAEVDGRLCQLGMALRHPPVHLEARPAPRLEVTGGRADLVSRQAAGFLRAAGLPPAGALEIELAVPAYMGLGSDAAMGLAAARALAALHGAPFDDARALAAQLGLPPEDGLATAAFAGGGLLLVDDAGALVRRRAVAHASQQDDWVLVLVLPRVVAGAPESLESDRRRALLAGARGPDAARAAAALWSAAEADDFAGFAAALADLQRGNRGALQAAGLAAPLAADDAAALELMRAGGAAAYGQAPAGLALWGLVRGAEHSRELRKALAARLGHFGGAVTATICDNDGARHATHA